ncbi:DUF4031 domain-containing protein [Mariniluteicoccus flavus]
MAVLIDPPAWPAHGTVFAHLVSDTALEELHELAEAAGVHPRAFDRDHYDVPESLYAACVAAGAVPAPARELVAALRASGLRRTKAARRADDLARRERLATRWPLPDHSIAADLLDRWGARGRYYHDLRHLEHCLDALAALGNDDVRVTLAAWSHDAVYAGRAGEDEEASAGRRTSSSRSRSCRRGRGRSRVRTECARPGPRRTPCRQYPPAWRTSPWLRAVVPHAASTSSIWLIARVAPSSAPMSRACWSSSAVSNRLA